MADETATIALRPELFGEAEKLLASYAGLTASTFRYSTGVEGLRIRNGVGTVDLLPYQGQQIWDATFRGRSLTMGSMLPEPVPTMEYLRTYGAFFLHCGLTRMGNPSPADTHPLHGEFPNARFDSAELLLGRDAGGPFMALTGTFRYAAAFGAAYEARPLVVIHQGSSRMRIELAVKNLRSKPMELMYLAHINFRPVDGATLVDAVPNDSGHMRVRTNFGAGVVLSQAHEKLLADVQADLSLHRQVGRWTTIDPELVIFMKYPAGADGWAHSMQVLPDGSADFVSHRPAELPLVTRWTTRSGDQEASGFVLPATAEADGYIAEKAKGNVVMVAAGGEFRCAFDCGALTPDETAAMRRQIETDRG